MGSMIPIMDLDLDYEPSIEGWNFHASPARFRYLIWGIKSGKSIIGAAETTRFALGMPGKRIWIVAPTSKHLQVAWSECMNFLNLFQGLVIGFNRTSKEIRLVHGGVIECRSAERPDNLRGPNIDAMWIDEGAFMRDDAWWICRERVGATGGPIWVTTTPNYRNWIWPELIKGGMSADAPYGEFEQGLRFISHFPTEHFGWVSKEDIEDVRAGMPRDLFDREYGAMFNSEANQVFRSIEDAFSYKEPPEKVTGSTVIGVDLAKHQDFTAVIVMNADGEVLHIDHWNETEWTVAKPRLKKIAEDWNGGIILDTSNMGDIIEEDLRAEGLNIVAVNLHDAQKKTDIIQKLQIAFETKQIRIPSPRATWAGKPERTLYDELKSYAQSLTRGGRLSYSAPKGLHDDLVIALALANFGRVGGHAGGIDFVHEAFVPRKKWRPTIQDPSRKSRSQRNKRIFKNRSSVTGLNGGGAFWDR